MALALQTSKYCIVYTPSSESFFLCSSIHFGGTTASMAVFYIQADSFNVVE